MKRLFASTLLLLSSLCVAKADNPLVKTMYTADPTARVIDGKLFVFPSSDVAPVEGKGNNGFHMPYYHVFSSDNLIDWEDHGRQIDQNDIPWGEPDSYALWAPDCVEYNGKFYHYFPAQPKGDGKQHFTGVAVASRPEGPYKVEKKPIAGMVGIDPNVFIDDDGTPYIYWGSSDNLMGCKLKKNMKELDGTPVKIESLPPSYKEASFVFKREGIYYFTFSHATPYRNCELSYATSTSPLGGFKYQGAFMRQWDDCWTNHHSFVEYEGRWILFYHHMDVSERYSKMRSICADYVTFAEDGRINEVLPTVRGIGVCDAASKIQIDRYSKISSEGAKVSRVSKELPANWQVEKLADAKYAWVRYDNVDFAEGGYQSVTIRTTAASEGIEGQKLEIRENGYYGDVVATIDIPKSDGEATAKINYSPEGVTNLYFFLQGAEGSSYAVDCVWFAK